MYVYTPLDYITLYSWNSWKNNKNKNNWRTYNFHVQFRNPESTHSKLNVKYYSLVKMLQPRNMKNNNRNNVLLVFMIFALQSLINAQFIGKWIKIIIIMYKKKSFNCFYIFFKYYFFLFIINFNSNTKKKIKTKKSLCEKKIIFVGHAYMYTT